MGAALTALLLCASLAVPVPAGNSGAVEITWLTAAGRPHTYNERLGWLTLYDDGAARYSAIDLATGKRLEYDYVGPFYDGMARVMKYNADGSEAYGFITETGTVTVPLEYDFAGIFRDGLTWVEKDGKAGCVDKTGAVVIPMEYDYVGHFIDGLTYVEKTDVDGNWKYGYIDKTGAMVIPMEYTYAGHFSDGLAYVAKIDADGSAKYGLINTTGVAVVPLEHDSAGTVQGGENDTVRLCYIKQGSSCGIFENPYYGSSGEDSSGSPIIVTAIALAIFAAAAALAAKLVLKRKLSTPIR